MGWVGIGVLLVTTIYFFHRYPPRSWRSNPLSPPPDFRSEARLAPVSEPQPTGNDAGPGLQEPEENIEETTEETTPKASASTVPPPILAVPELNLHEDTSNHDTIHAETARPRQTMNGTTNQSQPIDRNSQTPTTESVQPASPSQPQRRPPSLSPSNNTSSLMPPPSAPRPRPTPQPNRGPPTNTLPAPRPAGNSLMPPPSAASGLRVPTNAGSRLSNSTLAPSLKKTSASRKVVLDPGYSPLDWAALVSNPNSQLRGKGLPSGLVRVTPSMLKMHNGRKGRDAWTSYLGKVYNITPYVPYHPGGKGEMLRGAGKDSAQLFQDIHPWVNWDGILGECLVGILVSENDVHAENTLDAMD